MGNYIQRYWSHVDLHSHTTNEITRSREKLTNSYTHRLFYEYVKEQGVQLKAVTNHNTLNLQDHVKHALICDFLSVNYIPGVEVDYFFGEKPFHAVTLLSPTSDVVCYSKRLAKIIKDFQDNSKEILLNEDNFMKLHANTSFIFIPHAKKTEGFLANIDNEQNDIATTEWIIETIKNGLSIPVLLENTKNYHQYSVVEQINERIRDNKIYFESLPCIVNTDYKFDSDVERKQTISNKIRYYIFSQPTYRGLEISIRNHGSRFSEESNIISRDNFIESLKLHTICNDDFCINGRLDMSPGLNMIIGNSGTGKTLLLNEIFKRTNNNESLSAVQKDEKTKTDPYISKIKDLSLFDIVQEKADKLIVIEIPKIYNEILKATDTKQPALKFGVDDRSRTRTIMMSYKSRLTEFEQNHIQLLADSKAGEDNLRNIQTATEFIRSNKVEKGMYVLSEKKYSLTEKKLLQKQIDKAQKYVDEKEKIDTYFLGMKDFLKDDHAIMVDKIVDIYHEVLSEIVKSKALLASNLQRCVVEEKLHCLINTAISNSVEKLGQREKAVREKESLIVEEAEKLVENVKKSLLSEYKNLTISCAYPLPDLSSTVDSINSNEFSRLKIEITSDELNKVEMGSSRLLNTKNIIQKLREFGKMDFLNNDDVKMMIVSLWDDHLRLSDLVISDIPLSLEIKVKTEWKNINEINPGDLAKVFMNYYFNKIIREKQPNVIVIDQPENDVDKTFITEVLSAFIIKYKKTTQFIITTHDPILAVNSDANRIILCELDKKNRINYFSFALEETSMGYDYIGTDNVSQILDGGIPNIKTRYQIYGGTINE